jgi:hypothetical protein
MIELIAVMDLSPLMSFMDLSSLVYLDSAVTNKSQRLLLWRNCFAKHIITAEESVQLPIEAFMWLEVRSIFLQAIKISPVVTDDQFFDFFTEENLWTTYVTNLDLSNCYQLNDGSFMCINLFFPNLQKIKLNGNYEQNFRRDGIGAQYFWFGISNCKNLLEIDYRDAYTTTDEDTHINLLIRCKNLKVLHLEGCKRSHLTNDRFYWTNLCQLTLSNHANDDDLRIISLHCSHLQSFSVHSDDVSDSGIWLLTEKCSQLTVLDISGCFSLTEQIDTRLPARLIEIDLSGMLHASHYTIDRLVTLCGGNLKKLSFGRGLKLWRPERYGNITLTSIALHATNLEELHILVERSSHNFKNSGLLAIIKSCTSITKFSFMARKTDAFIAHMASSWSKLTYLDVLGHLNNLSDTSLQAIASNLQNLEVLRIGKSSKCTDNGFAQLFTNCTKLRELRLHHIANLKSRSFALAALTCCTCLKKLSITNGRFFDDGVEWLAALSKSLRILYVKDNKYLTSNHIIEITKQIPKLEDLDVTGCVNVPGNFFRKDLQPISKYLEHCSIYGNGNNMSHQYVSDNPDDDTEDDFVFNG